MAPSLKLPEAAEHDLRTLQLQVQILEIMREGVVLIDDRRQIRRTNPAFDELFGYAPHELDGQSIDLLCRLGDVLPAALRRRPPAPLATRRSEPVELECLRRDGSRFTASCVVTPLTIDGADHWLAALDDVSERKLLERQILEVSNREQQRIGNWLALIESTAPSDYDLAVEIAGLSWAEADRLRATMGEIWKARKAARER